MIKQIQNTNIEDLLKEFNTLSEELPMIYMNQIIFGDGLFILIYTEPKK